MRHPWILEMIKITSKFLSRTTSNVVRGRDEKTCQVWFGSCLAASLSPANNANARVARAIGQARGQRMRDWNKTLGLLSCSCWGWQPSDADHDGLGRSLITTMWFKVMLHRPSSNTWLAPRKVLKNLQWRCILLIDTKQGRFLLNLFKTTDDRIACSLISAVDIFEAENAVRDSKYSASQMAIDECAL